MALTRQRVPIKPIVLEARALTRADLACLPNQRQENGIAQKLRSHHHRIARLDAAGLRPHEICEIAQISHMRLHTLRKTPAYEELVAQYRNTVNAAFEAAQDEFARASMSNMMRAEHMIADHFDEAEAAGELIPLKTLDSIAGGRADRFGYPKGTVVAKVNVGNQLERAMVRSGRTITVDAKSSSPALASRGTEAPPPSEQSSSPNQPRALVSRRGF